jgi:hypothetical protein
MIDILSEHPRAFHASRRFFVKKMLAASGTPWRVIRPTQVTQGAMLFVHVNLTDVPHAWLADAKEYETSVNAKALSINRNLYSKAKIARNVDYDGPVIVKTVLNHRGIPELRHGLRANWSGRAKRLAYRTIWKDRWHTLCPEYPVLDSKSDVDQQVWEGDTHIVERFIPGTAQPPITKHRWEFLGELSLLTRSVFDDVLCKPENFVHVEQLHDVPQEMQDLRAKLNLDFGSIDYFETVDGAIAIDCNKTTTADEEWIVTYPFIAEYIADCGAWLSEKVKA